MEISTHARELLKEIYENQNDAGEIDLDYWKEKFENFAISEDLFCRSCFDELIDEKLLIVMWADNAPYHMTITARGLEVINTKIESARNDEKIKTEHKKYDVFLSHANANKLDYVNELYDVLSLLGINIFYDRNSLSWGDNWKNRILDGTASSEFAIIVISKEFFGREWTEKELSEFLVRQNKTGQKIVLPLLYNVTPDDMRKQYPLLEEIQAIRADYMSKEQVAILFAKELIKRLKGKI